MGCSNFNFQSPTCTQVDVGFDYKRVLSVTDDSGTVDITNKIFKMTIKSSLDGPVILTLDHVLDDISTGFFIPTPISGIIEMIITDADTTTVGPGNFPYQMTVTDDDDRVEIFMEGRIQFFEGDF